MFINSTIQQFWQHIQPVFLGVGTLPSCSLERDRYSTQAPFKRSTETM